MKTADLQVFGHASKYWIETNQKTHSNLDISSKIDAERLLVCSLHERQIKLFFWKTHRHCRKIITRL